jgi:hypothetical protein
METMFQIALDDIHASQCGCGGCCRACSAHQDDLLLLQDAGLICELVRLVAQIEDPRMGVPRG